MNILDAEDMIKGLPDQTLMQQAQMPTGELPQFLVISEIQRRSDMRKRHEAQMQEQSQGTVKDQIMREGIAAMMPQQPMGMPPQMMPQGMPPQGMPPQGMPTGMPPMGMAAGGVVQMQRGGFLDQYVAGAEAGPMPGGSTVRDQIDRLLASGASYPEILSFVSKTFYGRPEVLEYVQSKVAMPEPTMGLDGVRERRPSIDTDALISGMVSERVPQQPRIGDVTASDIYSDSFALGDIDLDMPSRARPSMDFGSAIRGLTDSPAVSRLGEVGGGIADIFGAIGSSMSESVRNAPLGRAIAASEESAMRDPDRYSRTDALPYVGDKPGVESVEPVDQALAVVQEAQTDRSDPRYRPDFSIMEDYFADFATGDKSVQGASPVQTQAKPKGEPQFDISDILDESRRMTQANMLMQLGAGIAGGDLSKGLSAAGEAGMKGAQEQRALDIRKRLAEYQAGREDLAREEKASQFERTFGLSERELAGKMEISKDVTAREGLRGLLALYETAFGEEKEQLKARIMPLINRLLGEEQKMGIGGMQTRTVDFNSLARG